MPVSLSVSLGPGPEFDLVRSFVAAANASIPLPVSIGDDAAGLRLPAQEVLLLTTDVSVEEVHFRREWMTWETIGYRAAAVALSDLAAMAASPLGVLVTLVLPPELGESVVESIGTGLGECLRSYGAPLLGGDISRSVGGVSLGVTAVGSCSRPITRSGAKPGDELWVTGSLGGAAAALWDLSHCLEPDPRGRKRLERPMPRLRESQWLAERVDLRAMIDLSDGLAGDAGHVAAASEVRIELEADAVPLAEELQGFEKREVALRLAVAGGEDYELFMAAKPDDLETVRRAFEATFGVQLTRVGRVREGQGVAWLDARGGELSTAFRGYNHFSAGDGC